MSQPLRVLDAARSVVDEVHRLIESAKRPLVHVEQLREAAQSIPANIREGRDRGDGRDRRQYYKIARSSAGETDEHLRSNVSSKRIALSDYWRLHHRLSTIRRMLTRLIEHETRQADQLDRANAESKRRWRLPPKCRKEDQGPPQTGPP